MSTPQDPWTDGVSADVTSSESQQDAERPAPSAYERDRMRLAESRGQRNRAEARGHNAEASQATTPWCSVEGRQVLEDFERYREYRVRFYSRYDPVEDPWAPDVEVIYIPIDLPSEAEPLDEVLRREPKKIGLNAMKTFYHDDNDPSSPTKYGNNESQFNDCAALGAKVIRQFGRADLLWGMLAGDRTVKVPLESGLAAIINDPQNVDRIAQLFAEAHRVRTKVIFTFLTLGGGEEVLDPTLFPDPMGEMKAVPILSWSDEHLDQEADGYPYSYISDGDSATIKRWLTHSLDVRSGYKRHYFRLIAAHAVQLLYDSLAEAKNALGLDGTVTLLDLIEGIEIFNEIDTRARIIVATGADIEAQAYWWALAYVECAEAFYELGVTEGIPILLPGLASYIPEIGFTWPEKLTFIEAFCIQIAWEARKRGLHLPTVASGLDYHWYHRSPGTERHIGYLIQEVSQLRALLDERISSKCHITIMETGVAVDADFVPLVKRGLTSGSATSLERLDGDLFQSNEIWRRLGGVLASAAVSAGWHSWMSGFPEAFELMGLRVDDSRDSATYASAAHTRWSWFAFERLTSMLGDVVAGRMILPEIESLSELSSMTKADGLVVLEFTLGAASSAIGRYAYLVFYDPTAAANGATVEVTATFSAIHASLVSTRVDSPPVSSGGGQITLPTGFAAFDPDAVLTLPAVLRVYKEDSPWLVRTSQRLRWSNVKASEIAKP